jgi:hypothetical protein
MAVCFDGLKTGPICFGDLMSRLHGSEIGMTTVGLALFAGVALIVFTFVFKDA